MDEALNAKYIIVRDHLLNEIPIVFCSLLKHKTVAFFIDTASSHKGVKVVSAGFAVWDKHAGRFIATGESISLEVKSRYDIDSDIINKYLNIRR